MAIWDVQFYATASGRTPVADYIDALSKVEAARVVADLAVLQETGAALGMPHVRHLVGTDLWELRVRGQIQHRLLYVAVRGRRILLLHAFTKKTQQTPRREIETAERRLADHRERFPS
jgi:phage-related protein